MHPQVRHTAAVTCHVGDRFFPSLFHTVLFPIKRGSKVSQTHALVALNFYFKNNM